MSIFRILCVFGIHKKIITTKFKDGYIYQKHCQYCGTIIERYNPNK